MSRFRELVGSDTGLSEKELAELREHLHSLAEVIVDLAWDRLTSDPMSQEAPQIENSIEQDVEVQ